MSQFSGQVKQMVSFMENSGDMSFLNVIIKKDDASELERCLSELLQGDKPPSCDNCSEILKRLIFYACKVDSKESASLLLDKITECMKSSYRAVIDSIREDMTGRTMLHVASIYISSKCLKFLLDRKANPSVRCNQGLLPIELLLEKLRNQLEINSDRGVSGILYAAQKMDLLPLTLLINHTDDISRKIYNTAVSGDSEGLAIILTAFGGDIINLTVILSDGKKGKLLETLAQSIVEDSIEIHHKNIVAKLNALEILMTWLEFLNGGAESRINFSDYSSIMLVAAEVSTEDFIQLLLNTNVNPNVTDAHGNTCLHVLYSTRSYVDICRITWLLIDRGASPFCGNKIGVTAVHLAAGQGHADALKIILAHYPSAVGVLTVIRESPLFWAARNGHMLCVKILLSFGSNKNLCNIRGQTAADVTCSPHMYQMITECTVECTKDELNCDYLSQFDQERLCEKIQTFKDFKQGKRVPPLDINCLPESTFKRMHSPPLQQRPEPCRYFSMSGGCVRGESCLFSHTGGKIIPQLGKLLHRNNDDVTCQTLGMRVDDVSRRKIFVGGLSPSVESDDLWKIFESNFGPVVDAVVIGSQTMEQKFASRGFGFVTFRHEQSAFDAVQEHFVVLLGKKVEIKGAVPRPALLEMERKRGQSLELNSLLSKSFIGVQNIDSNGSSVVKEVSTEVMYSEVFGGLNEKKPFGQGNTDIHQSPSEQATFIHPLPLTHGPRPVWLLKLREWLPKFLEAACARLGEGEYYPLSSLKGDFRATCGLEMDHASIGYPKLSDFVRSLHDICRMKIVPVGRGPATHMVLLPLPNPHVEQEPTSLRAPHISGHRTYADAVYRNHLSFEQESQNERDRKDLLSATKNDINVEQNSISDLIKMSGHSEKGQHGGGNAESQSQKAVEYVTELLALLNRPGCESQAAILGAQKILEDKTSWQKLVPKLEMSPPPTWHRNVARNLPDTWMSADTHLERNCSRALFSISDASKCGPDQLHPAPCSPPQKWAVGSRLSPNMQKFDLHWTGGTQKSWREFENGRCGDWEEKADGFRQSSFNFQENLTSHFHPSAVHPKDYIFQNTFQKSSTDDEVGDLKGGSSPSMA